MRLIASDRKDGFNVRSCKDYITFKIEHLVQFKNKHGLKNTLASRPSMSECRCVFLRKGADSIRAPPVRFLKINVQKSKQEDKIIEILA